jgi:hypothetical protein
MINSYETRKQDTSENKRAKRTRKGRRNIVMFQMMIKR